MTTAAKYRVAHTELWAVDSCEHGWTAPHCIRDAEGSCPFEHDRRNPAADCRCDAAGSRSATLRDVLAWLARRGWRAEL